MPVFMRTHLLLFSILLFLAACHTKEKADLILHNGKVYTVDSAFSMADAFAVKDGKILAIGSSKDIMAGYAADSVVDAQERAVYPGFIDAHAHFVGYGRSLYEVNLYGC